MKELTKSDMNRLKGTSINERRTADAKKPIRGTSKTSYQTRPEINPVKSKRREQNELETTPKSVSKQTTTPAWKALGGFYGKKKPTRILATKPQQHGDTTSSTGSDNSHVSSTPDEKSFESIPVTPFGLLDSHRIYEVNGHPYLVLQKIGKGGSSKVYKVLAPDMSTYALKRVDISQKDPSIVESFINEIGLLKMLQGSERIISLKDSEVDDINNTISIVLEIGDIDLRSLIEKNRTDDEQVDPNFLRLMWQQMLEAVQIVHNANVVHGDLKPANFLFVAGTLKLIDFGIAKSIAVEQDTTNIERTNQVGTLNYMSPEALKLNDERRTFKVGRAADVWSLGCILYQLVYNRPPFPQADFIHKIQAIIDDSYEIEFPTVPNRPDFNDLLDVMKSCLQRDPKKRPKIDELLAHPYITFRAPEYSKVESQILSLILAIQDHYLGYDFSSPLHKQTLEVLAEQFRTGAPIQFPREQRPQRLFWV